MTDSLHARASCQDCDWYEEGAIAAVDKAADKHTKQTTHTTRAGYHWRSLCAQIHPEATQQGG